jgi:hypothetical protein
VKPRPRKYEQAGAASAAATGVIKKDALKSASEKPAAPTGA